MLPPRRTHRTRRPAQRRSPPSSRSQSRAGPPPCSPGCGCLWPSTPWTAFSWMMCTGWTAGWPRRWRPRASRCCSRCSRWCGARPRAAPAPCTTSASLPLPEAAKPWPTCCRCCRRCRAAPPPRCARWRCCPAATWRGRCSPCWARCAPRWGSPPAPPVAQSAWPPRPRCWPLAAWTFWWPPPGG